MWAGLAAALLAVAACDDATPGRVGADLIGDATGGDAVAETVSDVIVSDTGSDARGDVVATTCAGVICEDFEHAGAGFDPSVWSIVSPDCSGTGTSAIDPDIHRGASGHALRVSGGGGYCDHVFLRADVASIAGDDGVVHARFYLRLSDALGQGHTTFLAMRDDADGGKHVRMGGQSGILMWNRESDDATLPVLSPAGIAKSRPLETNTWTCVELAVDGLAGSITTSVDGVVVDGLIVDASATADVDEQWLRRTWHPALATFGLGWESYAGQAMTLWFDDVVIGSEPIGCDASPSDE